MTQKARDETAGERETNQKKTYFEHNFPNAFHIFDRHQSINSFYFIWEIVEYNGKYQSNKVKFSIRWILNECIICQIIGLKIYNQ